MYEIMIFLIGVTAGALVVLSILLIATDIKKMKKDGRSWHDIFSDHGDDSGSDRDSDDL